MTEVEGYEDLVEIGKGGFAVVYRARQVAFDRTVALKVLSRVDLDGHALRRFERECRAVGSLSWHPNIVVVYDAGTTADGLPYLAMEFLERGSLAERVRRLGPMTWAAAAKAGIQVAGALESAHRAGMLHRDVKPENVLVGVFGEAKLADFGIAAIEGSTATVSGTVTASIAHAAPEVLGGSRASIASDIYSLGSTLFELVSARPAFVLPTDDSLVPVMARVVSDPVPDLRRQGVPEAFALGVESAMAKDPAQRPASAAALGQMLQGVQQTLGQPVTPMPLREGGVGAATVTVPQVVPSPVVSPEPAPTEPAPTEPVPLSPEMPPTPPAPAPPGRRSPALVVGGAVAAFAAAAAAVLLLLDPFGSDEETAGPTGVTDTTEATATTAPPTSDGTATTVDTGTPPAFGVWTVILASRGTSGFTRADVEDEASGFRARGVTDAAVLLSDDYPSLNPGFWVVYTGIFPAEDGAVDWCRQLRDRGLSTDCYQRVLGEAD